MKPLGDAGLAAMRKIVEECQRGRVCGQMVDLYSASAVVAVADKLNPENLEKLKALSVPKAVRLAFRCVMS